MHLLLAVLSDFLAKEVLAGEVEGRVLELGTSAGDKDLVALVVAARGVVTSVGDTPRVVGDHPAGAHKRGVRLRWKRSQGRAPAHMEWKIHPTKSLSCLFSEKACGEKERRRSRSETGIAWAEQRIITHAVAALVGNDPETHANASGGEPLRERERKLSDERLDTLGGRSAHARRDSRGRP